MPPPVTSTALPHDLAQMFPTPPSQEPQIHAASPATSTAGDYINPASAAMCHAVMSPEKQVAVCEKKHEEDVKKEIAEVGVLNFFLKTDLIPIEGLANPAHKNHCF